MKNEIKILPQLRFTEFNGENQWKLISINDSCEILNNLRKPITSTNRGKGAFPYYGASGIIDYIDEYIFDEELVLVGEDGAKWGSFEHTAFIVNGRYWVNNHAHVLKPKFVKSKFLESYLVMIDFSKYVTGAAPPKLTLGNLKNILIPIPSPQEQQKIASCLSSLDNLITAHKEKLEALKDHKKGLMQNLFPQEGEKVPKYRFPEFKNDGDWMEKKLSEIGEFIGGGTPSTSNPEYWNGNIQWYTPTEVKTFNLTKSVRSITEKGLNNSSAKLLPIGSILITTRATIGDAAITKWECSTNQGFQSLVVNKNQLNSFWYYWILNNKQEFLRRSSGSTFKEIGKTELEIIPTISPSIKEQQKIASCLLEVDILIQSQETKIKELQNHKKGLMQGLFPKSEN